MFPLATLGMALAMVETRNVSPPARPQPTDADLAEQKRLSDERYAVLNARKLERERVQKENDDAAKAAAESVRARRNAKRAAILKRETTPKT